MMIWYRRRKVHALEWVAMAASWPAARPATAVEESGFGEACRCWRSLVAEHLAVIPDDLRTARIDRAVTSTILTIARWEGRPTQAPRREASISDLIHCLVAALDAPVSPRTR